MRVWLKPLVFLTVAALAACGPRGSAAQGAPNAFALERTIPLRTSLFVPELDRLFVAVRAGEGGPARILVLRPRP